MIWNRLTTLAAIIPGNARREAVRKARRWTKAALAEPKLREDLIVLGGLLAGQPAILENGWPTPALPDPQQRDYLNGRRDMAQQLLALMSLTPYELNALMQEPDYATHDDD